MCGGCPGAKAGDWLSPVIRTHTQREAVARLVGSAAARVRSTPSGWTVASPTGRTIVAATMTELWSGLLSCGQPEPAWEDVRLPESFDEPEPLPDRRTPLSVTADTPALARQQVEQHLAAPHCFHVRVAEVHDGTGTSTAVLEFDSATRGAIVLSGMLAHGRGDGRGLDARITLADSVVTLQTWDGHGLGFSVERNVQSSSAVRERGVYPERG